MVDVKADHPVQRRSIFSCTQGITAVLSKFTLFIPSPPGLLAHPSVPGGSFHAPLLSRGPLVVESRARRHSKALDKTLQNLLSEVKIEVTCEFKVRSKVKIRRFDVLSPCFEQNVVKGLVKVWYEYKWHTKKTSRSRSGHKRSLYVRIVKSCDTCFMAQFRRSTRTSRLKYHLA